MKYMPHRKILKLAAAHGVESALEVYKETLGHGIPPRKLIPFRNGILTRLIGMARENERHDYSPVQLAAIKRITKLVRAAKTPKEIDKILLITCFLKLEKQHTQIKKK